MEYYYMFCIFFSATIGLVNFGVLLHINNKLDEIKSEISSLKKEKDND